jgi:tRNA threonylcarbamoyladenosine biosynthesis protein TsaB
MLILTIKTDQPLAEIGLYQDDTLLKQEAWQAHRQLAETIHQKIKELLAFQGKAWADIEGLVVFKGPGSFTGLRIGTSLANALAYANKLPIVGAMGVDWQTKGLGRLQAGENEQMVLPEYGAPVHITQQRK